MILSKKFLRKKYLQKREQLSIDKVKKFSEKIRRNLKGLSYYKDSQNIMVYINFKNEPETIQIIKDSLKLNKNVYIPRINKKEIEAVRIKNLKNLKINTYGIKEPSQKLPASSRKIFDIIIIPGILFDKKGNRIGFGKGFYDRFLKKYKGKKIALAYDFQLKNTIPSYDYDEKIDIIITEKRIYKSNLNPA